MLYAKMAGAVIAGAVATALAMFTVAFLFTFGLHVSDNTIASPDMESLVRSCAGFAISMSVVGMTLGVIWATYIWSQQ